MELLNIADRDYGDYLLSKVGLKQTFEERGAVEIVTASGGLYHCCTARKRKLTVCLDMVPEDVLDILEKSMAKESFPVIYRRGGSDSGGMFTLSSAGISASAALILGGVFYFSNVVFDLREV